MNQKGAASVLVIFLSLIALAVIIIWLIYGSLNPCDMLKKEVAWQSGKSGEGQVGYILFGGFINNAIDTLSPLQCAGTVLKIKTGSTVDEVLRGMGK